MKIILMKKISFFLIFIFLTNCASKINYNKISLKEKQRIEDIKTCNYYGFNKGTTDFSFCLMKLENTRNEIVLTRKMLECENVRRDNSSSAVSGFWGGVLLGLRESLACD
tara:strand:- start:68 stop:397 length:330 start_codon:yes stop_codon:yes gene_type:complete